MVSSMFIPAQSLFSTREISVALTRMPSCHNSLVIHASKRSSQNATPPVHRPSITSIVNTLNAGHVSVVQVLQRHAPHMRSCDWFALLEALGKLSNWRLILETFRWMQKQKWYKPDSGFHVKLIVTMGKAKQLRMAVWFFKEVKRNGHRPDTSLYNALITAHLQGEDKNIGFAKALQLFEEMKTKANCKPDLVTYNILLRGSAQVRDVLHVERFFEEMEAENIHPNLISYNGVIGAYGKAGDLVQMEKTLFIMRILKHIKPDTVTSNTLIESYGQERDFIKMEQVFKSMTAAKNRQSSRPDAKTYNILMASYAWSGEVEKMEWSRSRMEAANFKLNLRSYEVLMIGYGEAGALASMSECFYQMLQAGLKPQKSTLNLMIRAYCKHNCFEEAEELLNDALGWETRPRTSSYLILLRAYVKERRSSDVERLMERMAEVRIAPCAATFLEALESFSLPCGYEETLLESATEAQSDGEDEEDFVDAF